MQTEKELEDRIFLAGIAGDEESRLLAFLEEIKAYHKQTYSHCVRVGVKAYDASAYAECNPRNMLIAGLLHDLGKLAIEINLLDKKTGFNEEDYSIMQAHPFEGYMLAKNDFPFAAEVILRHHMFEKIPYPASFPKMKKGISKRNVEKHARLLSIIDFYDAMCTRHDNFPYDCGGRKQRLLEGRKGMEVTINSLYAAGILS
ncbi:MAG: HD domain-containing protein [Candidatus Nanoarchaeia archaeon]|nr:HD domain-containing protein [Candidatus Nanoarchaeia archaeon]